MAGELICHAGPNFTGLTVKGHLFQAGAQVGADIVTAESGTTGNYVGDMPAVGAGTYAVSFTDAADNQLCVGDMVWDGTAEVVLDTQVDELHKLQGLNVAAPMTTTTSLRVAGGITLAITGNGETTSTVTRT